jgi:hypothetical protein
MWHANWTKFSEDLGGIPSGIDSFEVARPATPAQLAPIEKAISQALPPKFRKFLVEVCGGVELSWSLESGVLVRLKDEGETIYGGSMSFHVDRLLSESPQFSKDFEPDDFHREYRPGKLLCFASTPNGDQFAVVLDGPETDSIRYLSHDLDDIHFYKVADDMDSFISNYARLGFAGPEYWIWEQFTNERTTPIDPRSPKANEFLQAIRKNQRSAEAEAQQRQFAEAHRRADYKSLSLPGGKGVLRKKDSKKPRLP